MSAAALVSLFLVGLLGGMHCLGMCGGIVTALTVRMPGRAPGSGPAWRRQLAYHAGRISTYVALGALAGGAGSAALLLDGFLPVQIGLYLAAQLMLVALGLYLLGATRYLGAFERAGGMLWRRLQPHASRLLPVRSVPRAYAVGTLWGLLPCGLVYSVLATALMSAGPANGAAAMLAFGAGTLPSLLAAGALLPALERLRRAQLVRQAAGGAIIAFGLLGLAQAGPLDQLAANPLFCTVTPR
jgi:sulfite exporter TauE/SafE